MNFEWAVIGRMCVCMGNSLNGSSWLLVLVTDVVGVFVAELVDFSWGAVGLGDANNAWEVCGSAAVLACYNFDFISSLEWFWDISL